MKTLVVYDSVHGNTGTIAQSIGDAIPGEVTVLRVGAVSASDLAAYDLLIVGSPTHGGRATDAIQDLLKQVQPPALEGTRVAAFDTRFSTRWVRIFGFAAPRIAKSLKEKGGTPVGSPGDFVVKGTEGPLKEGEVERAAAWAKEIAD